MSFGEQLKGALGVEKFKELAEGLKGLTGENAYEKAYAEIADVYGLNIEDYQTKGLFGTTRLDSKSLQRDAMITNAVAKAVPGLKRENIKDIIARTEFERGGDGGIDPDSLVDKNTGELTQTGKDLFGQTLSDEEEADLLGGGSKDDGTGTDDIDAQSAAAAGDMSAGMSDEDAESAAAAGAYGGMYKGGAVKTKRKKGLGRLK